MYAPGDIPFKTILSQQNAMLHLLKIKAKKL